MKLNLSSEHSNSTTGNHETSQVLPEESIIVHSESNFYDNDDYDIQFFHKPAWKIFLITSAHILLGPFLIPIASVVFGRHIIQNLGMTNCAFYKYELMSWIWFVMLIVVSVIDSDKISLHGPLGFSTGIIILTRTCLVSFKYGYFKKSLLDKYFSVSLTLTDLRKVTLFVSWQRCPPDIIESEVNEAYKRLKLTVNNNFLKFKTSIPLIFLRHIPNKIDEATPNHRFCSQSITKMLLNLYSDTQKPWKYVSEHYLGLGYSLVPYLMILAYDGHLEFKKVDVVIGIYFVVCFYNSFILSRAIFGYFLVGITDFKRKLMMMRQCSSLISQTDAKYSLIQGLPLLDLTDPCTVHAWYIMRRAFLSFGKRFTLRNFLYISMVLPPSVSVVLLLYMQLFGVISNDINRYIGCLIYLSLLCLIFILIIIWKAVALVRQGDIHKDLLLAKEGEFLMATLETDRTGTDYPRAIEHIRHVISRLDHDDVCRPLTVLGLTVTKTLFGEITAVFISGVALVLQQLIL